MSVKRVRFAPTDEHKFWQTDKPISYNSYTNEPLGFCLKCNSIKYSNLNGNRCMNCFVPKPAIKKSDSKEKQNNDNNYNLLSSKSAENLGHRSRSEDRNIRLEFLKQREDDLLNNNHHHSSRSLQKSHELENINENLYNNYYGGGNNKQSKSDFKLELDNLYSRNKDMKQSKSIWKCEKCEEVLHPGEVAISAEHAKITARWHPKCFACVECNELLDDLLYYNYAGKIYCKKHYDVLIQQPKVICAACDQSILTNEYVNAEGHFWHKEHFVCWDCENLLAGKKYIVSESKPFCLDCYTRSFSKKCNSCNWTIPPDAIRLTYENIDWHASPNCFKCFACHKNLLEDQFLLKNSLLFCSIDCKRKISVI